MTIARLSRARVVPLMTIVTLVSLCLAALPSIGSAQQPRPTQAQVDRMSGPMLGLRGSYDFDNRIMGYGAQARFPIDWNLQFAPSIDAYSKSGASLVQGNLDFIVTGRGGMFYLGGGLAIIKPQSGDAKYGANIYPGIDLPPLFDTPVRPFIEARWTFWEGNAPFRVVFGLNIPLGTR